MVDIPADHRVLFEFLAPKEIPSGKARVEVKVTPVVEKQTDQRSLDRGSDTALSAEEGATSPVDALFALFAPIRGTVDVDEIRMERIAAKHLKHVT
jgi:hypothetical protein